MSVCSLLRAYQQSFNAIKLRLCNNLLSKNAAESSITSINKPLNAPIYSIRPQCKKFINGKNNNANSAEQQPESIVARQLIVYDMLVKTRNSTLSCSIHFHLLSAAAATLLSQCPVHHSSFAVHCSSFQSLYSGPSLSLTLQAPADTK